MVHQNKPKRLAGDLAGGTHFPLYLSGAMSTMREINGRYPQVLIGKSDKLQKIECLVGKS